MKSFALFVLALFIGWSAKAQAPVCCDKNKQEVAPTAAFAAFGSDAKFRSQHPIPGQVDVSALKGEMVGIPVEEGKADAYFVAGPSDSRVALIVVHEWWGLNDHIKQEADRLFEELDGKVHVIALDMYRGEVATTRERASSLMQSVDDGYARSVIRGAADYLPAGTKVASIGWCFGGGWSLQTAIELNDRALGSVIYYGMPDSDPNHVREIRCDVLGIFAGKDGWITPEVVHNFESVMKAEGKTLTYKIFEGAEHAFANPSRDIYDEGAAEEANRMTREFLRNHLLME